MVQVISEKLRPESVMVLALTGIIAIKIDDRPQHSDVRPLILTHSVVIHKAVTVLYSVHHEVFNDFLL